MKRKCLLLLALFVFCCTVAASAQLKFGFRGGLGLPYMRTKGLGQIGGAQAANTGSTFGVHAGALALYQFSIGFWNVEFETDVQFAKLGARLTDTFLGVNAEGWLSIYYVQIPLRANFSFDLGLFNIFASAGPQVGIALFDTFKKSKGERDVKDFLNLPDGKYYETLDLALSMHAGVRLGSLPLRVTFYYDVGVLDIEHRSREITLNNHNFGVSLAYLLWDVYLAGKR